MLGFSHNYSDLALDHTGLSDTKNRELRGSISEKAFACSLSYQLVIKFIQVHLIIFDFVSLTEPKDAIPNQRVVDLWINMFIPEDEAISCVFQSGLYRRDNILVARVILSYFLNGNKMTFFIINFCKHFFNSCADFLGTAQRTKVFCILFPKISLCSGYVHRLSIFLYKIECFDRYACVVHSD